MNNVARCLMQQCIHAKLMVKPEEADSPAEYVEVCGFFGVFFSYRLPLLKGCSE